MFTTVLPVWGAALLLSVCCWSIGTWLVRSKSLLVAMLCGWCVFLLLCSVPWIVGFSSHWARPLFWAFFAVGLYLAWKQRRWADLACAAICTAVIVWALGYPFIRFPGMMAYGAHGVDMWGYVITAEWLQHHGIRTLPVVGVDAMRFNWTWHVLTIQERPLNYESLACLSSATGLEIAKAYLLYPVVLLASLAMALAREPRIFGFKYWFLAVIPALAVVFHPLFVQPWIAGYFGGSIAAGFTALALAGAVAAEKEARAEALALAVLMLVFCAALYTMKFLYVGLVVGAVPLAFAAFRVTLRLERRPLALTFRVEHRPLSLRSAGPWLKWILLLIGVEAFAVVLYGQDLPANTGLSQLPDTALGHFLGMFGGSSPYVWLGYDRSRDFDRHFFSNPVGAVALVAMLVLFVLVAWRRWRTSRDVLVPLFVGLCIALVGQAYWDELIMAKTLAIFGFTLLVMLAAASSGLRSWWLGLLAAAVCCLPCIRSAAQMQEVIYGPYIVCTEDNVAQTLDGQDWRFLSYLHYKEDTLGVDWTKNPETYSAVTHFLPEQMRERLAKKYHIINH
jgi:hypothetical protein